uniref:ribosomal RNA small subunit methyltransferase A n=1 Tax=Turicimonas muris TaxID=1796652 RepID=UPI00272AA9A7
MALVLKSHKAKKNFGQNFLHDDFWIEKIASAVDAQPGQNIVEIGPGQAALTRLMIRDAGCVTCIEIDKDLAQWLQKKFKPEKLALIEADVLKVDFALIKPGEKIRLVGNLPYNISSPLLFR